MSAQASPHSDVVLDLQVTIPVAVLRKLEAMRHLTHMSGEELASRYAAACIRTFDQPEWNSRAIQRMTDDELDEALQELLLERELRAEVAEQEGTAEAETHQRTVGPAEAS